MRVRLGLLGARADRRGLSIQTAEFARHMEPAKILGIDMGALSPYRNDWSMFPTQTQVVELGEFTESRVASWLRGLDVVYAAETFYADWIVDLARSMNVKTVVQINYEFCRWAREPELSRPDLFLAPSTWNLDRLPFEATHLPFPVARDRLPFVAKTKAETFLHIAGHRAIHDRNGTRTILQAVRYITQPCTILIRAQSNVPQSYPGPVKKRWVNLVIERSEVPDYWSLYTGDVLLMPRRYGGLSLPLNEAMSCGFPIIATDCEPQRFMLPQESLISTRVRGRFMTQAGEVEIHDADPRALATKIDEFASDGALIERLSKESDEAAEQISWHKLGPRYRALFDSL